MNALGTLAAPTTAAFARSALALLSLTIGAYLIGSVSFAYLAVRLLARQDLRVSGSGNLGALNAGRASGTGVFALVFLADAGKAAAAVLVAGHFFAGPEALTAQLLAGVGILLGHTHSIFLAGRGGKGLACAVGLLVVLAPSVLLGLLVVAGLVLLLTRDIHVAPAAAAFCFPAALWRVTGSPMAAVLAVPLALIVLAAHWPDVRRWWGKRRASDRPDCP